MCSCTETRTAPLRLIVARDGTINLPEIGPVQVQGEHFLSVKESLEHASSTADSERARCFDGRYAIDPQVFVLGEAKRPGSYTVVALGTITSACTPPVA